MGYPIQQSTTGQNLLFMLVLSSDHITGATGLTPTVTLSKNGAAFGSPAGAVSEVANGWYKVAGNATDSATLGPLVLHATGTGCDPWDDLFTVVAYNPLDSVRLGLTSLPNAAAAASGGLPTIGATIPNATAGQTNGLFIAGTNAATSITTALTANITGNLSGSVGSVSGAVGSVSGAVGSVTGPVGSVTSAITLPANPPPGFLVAASYGTAPAWYTAPPSAATVATTIWQDTTAGDFTTGGSIGQRLTTGIPNIAPGGTNGLFIAGTNAATTVTTAFTSTFTGNLSGNVTGSVGSVTGAVGSVTGAVGSVTGNVGGNVTGTVSSVVTKTGYALAAAGLDSIVVETGLNARQALSMCSAAMAGTVSGAPTGPVIIKACNDGATTRISAVVDANGNRTPTLSIPT